MGLIIGVDTGGTFTDTVVIDENAGVTIGKRPSTPPEFVEGVVASVGAAGEACGRAETLLRDTDAFVHGTTIVVNAIIQGQAAKIGLLATRGFGDTIFYGRSASRTNGLTTDQLHQFAKLAKPPRFAPSSRNLIREIDERIDYKGAVIAELDEDGARRAIEELVAEGVEALAVCLLWSFKEPRHEQRLREIANEVAPDLPVTLSCEVAPKMGEYERTATTGFNCAMIPIAADYMTRLTERLAGEGLTAPLLIMQGNGGAMGVEEARRTPVNLIGSGPAGGVLGAKFLGDALGIENIICTDVGGTSFDVGLIVDGQPLITPRAIVNQYALHLPLVDVVSIGAGGGSIARAEASAGMTRLRVGPQSAGASPGPVCYQKGGTMPTVTDADLVLGYIDPEYFLAGTMRLDIAAAKQAIQDHVAEPLGMSIDEAAAGIKRVADSHMADLIRQTTVERGYDPRDFTAFLYGGGGPLHGPAYASQLGLRSMIVPGGAIASVFSAWGIASADIHHTFEISRPMVAPFETSSIQSVFDELETQASARLDDDGIPVGRRVFQRVVEMRYALQTHEVAVSAPAGELSATAGDELIGAFEEAYRTLFGEGSGFSEAGVELINFRLHAYGQLTKPKPSAQTNGVTSSNPDPHTTRAIYWPELAERVETPVYQDLAVGSELAGPAVVELPTTTVALHPSQQLVVDELQNFVISE